ncbi:hypothetical protein ACFFNX_26300, partial [Actinoallomurus acaciae]
LHPPPRPYDRRPALPQGESPLALPPARPAYPSHPPESYRRPERDAYGRPYEQDSYEQDSYEQGRYGQDRYERDPYGRPARPEQDDSSPAAFPYGPYRQR